MFNNMKVNPDGWMDEYIYYHVKIHFQFNLIFPTIKGKNNVFSYLTAM